jgi:flagellar hook-associated protein 2
MGSTASTIFNGTSRFSQDFQNVISRASAIASLGITQLQADKATLSDQTKAMQSLDDVFKKLQDSLQGIQDAVGGASFQADVSDSSKLDVTVGDGAVENNYTVQVLNPGVQATSVTAADWVNDKAKHQYNLTISGKTYSFTPASNSADDVAASINGYFGDKVHASVLQMADGARRISIQATALGDSQPDILRDGTSLQAQKSPPGSLASYTVDGIGTGTTSTSRSIQIATGITVTLKDSTGTTPVDITITRSTSALSDAMTKFVSAYNDAVDAVDSQRGQANGALSGNPLVSDLSRILSQIPTFSSSGSIYGLKALGAELADDNTGHIEFNSFALMATDIMNPAGVMAFLGDSTKGGFLKSVTDLLNSVEAATTGLLPAAEAGITNQSNTIDVEIADQQRRVDDMTVRMQAQLSAADAMIASMEQQYSYLFGMFSAMQTAADQYK